MSRPLGRRLPTDFEHLDKYPLRALALQERPVYAPVVLGVNWYSAFDSPEAGSDRRWWVGRGDLGHVRGGHSVCLLPAKVKDNYGWWDFYDQGQEGACVGFACSRMMSLLNRRRYNAHWLYHEAQKVDEWEGEDYDGTSVRAALDILRTAGHVEIRRGKDRPLSLADGISENRWATTVEEVLEALGTPHLDYVTLMNSWGRSYPHYVRVPAEVLQRLLDEEGEAGMITDRS